MKEYNYFVDTNIFLRALLKDEEKTFKDCLRFLKEIKNGKIKVVTSNLVLAEINWTLLRFYKFPKEDTIKGLNSILSLKHLKFIDDFNSILAIKFYKSYSIKFIDALISSIPGISEGKMKVVSYDKDFDKLGDLRIEPREIIKNITYLPPAKLKEQDRRFRKNWLKQKHDKKSSKIIPKRDKNNKNT